MQIALDLPDTAKHLPHRYDFLRSLAVDHIVLQYGKKVICVDKNSTLHTLSSRCSLPLRSGYLESPCGELILL